jgi:hypothetical protein
MNSTAKERNYLHLTVKIANRRLGTAQSAQSAHIHPPDDSKRRNPERFMTAHFILSLTFETKDKKKSQ